MSVPWHRNIRRRSPITGPKVGLVFAVAIITTFSFLRPALAVPAFADQTGQPCSACHVGGFGPQLTTTGREFKLGGYTSRAVDFSVPISAIVVASYLQTAKDQSSAPAPHYGTNDNLALDQASLFLAGGVGDHFGALVQTTYDGIGRSFAWDNLDLRAVDTGSIAGQNAVFGLSLNNSPTVQDAWNTLPAWGYPYTDSALAPGPATATLISDTLTQNVLGLSAYIWWNSSIYAELGAYRSPGTGFLKAVGVDPADTSEIDGVAPYLRVAYQKDYGNQNFEVGAFGLNAALYPGRIRTANSTDQYTDLGLDASYQFLADSADVYSINFRYTSEQQHLGASTALGAATHTNDSLQDLRADASYYWHDVIGGTVGAFETTGGSDSLLYAANRTLKPDSAGLLFQIDGTPFGGDMPQYGTRVNLRVGVQYTLYTEFDGATKNYDGLGRSASANNTLRIFTWFAF